MTAMTMVQAINSALACTMAKDPSVLVLGQDVGFFGGVFRCTEGLYEKYGPHRALDTPIAEGGIVAAAIGMGVNGLRPVVEMQFADYIYPAIDQIISELARLRHRSGGEFWAPVVVRAPCGGGIVESEVSAWRVQVGDLVKEDQVLADVQTDKAIVEVGSPVSGRVIALGCEAGGVLAVGAELVRFEVEVEPAEDSSSAGSSNLAPHTDTSAAGTSAGEDKVGHASITAINAPTPSVNATNSGSGVLASPSLRRRAREEGIDLAAVPGSGPKGRISHGDLDAFIAAGGELVMQVPGRQRREGKTDVRITGLRRVIALKMQKTKRDIPHYSYIEEVDVTQLEALRVMLNEVRTDAQPKLTLIPFLARALVRALPQFPHCNARFDDVADILTQHAAVHVGIATMTAGGLMVPVVKHCESLDLWQTAAEVARVSAAARDKKAAPAELSGSTITITSLGAIGGIATTPVINAPETAIIGVNKMQQRPVVIDGAIVVRTMMNLSASFDHRIVDGYDGAQLVQALKRMLENPGAIFV